MQEGSDAKGPAWLERIPAALRDELLAEVRVVRLPADVPPWRDTGLSLAPGDVVTWLARGRVVLSEELDLSSGPRLTLWGRIGPQGRVFNGPGATWSFAADRAAALELGILQGEWASPTGALGAPPEAWSALRGGFEVVLLRWRRPGLEAAREGLERLAAHAPEESGLRAEAARLAAGDPTPPGWTHHPLLGRSGIFRAAREEGRDVVRLAMQDDLAIVRKPAAVAIAPETQVAWRWCVEALPSDVAEDTLPTHDYLSVAVEFDDGRDLSWFWSATLPQERFFACPIPAWSARETHLVVRSGAQGLGRWQEERRRLHEDCLRVYGEAPQRVVAVWLIAVSAFRRRPGAARFADIRIEAPDGAIRVL